MEPREKLQPTLCVSEKAWLPSYLGLFFLDPEDIKLLNLGAFWNLPKKQDFLDLVSYYGAQSARFKAHVHRDRKGPNLTVNLNLNLKEAVLDWLAPRLLLQRI